MKNVYLFSLALVLSSCATSTAISDLPVFKILKPTGPYKVGTSHYNFIDKTRIDPYSTEKKHRELPIQVWYPAVISADDKLAAYEKKEVINFLKEIIAEANKMPLAKLKNLDSLKSNSYLNAKISNQQASYPVLIFSPGFGGYIRGYTSLVEELASHGYIVFGTSHAKSLSNDKLNLLSESEEHQVWVDDVKFVLDKIDELNHNDPQKLLISRLDTQQIGSVGHSFGGSVAFQISFEDLRCKAAVNLDGALFAKTKPHILTKPVMSIEGSDFGVRAEDKQKFEEQAKMLSTLLKKSTPHTAVYRFYITGADHKSFSDEWLINRFLFRRKDSISPERGIEITRKLLLWFFDKHLKGKEQQKFPNVKQYPEIKNILK